MILLTRQIMKDNLNEGGMLKMKKSIEKIFILIMIVSLAFGIIGLNYSYASEATISVSAAKIGQEFTVTVNIPADAIGYQGKIEVTFADNSTKSSGVLTNVTGITGDYAHPGNMTAKFTAPVAGNAKVRVVELTLTGRDASKLNSQSTLEQTFSVAAADAPAQQPQQPQQPTTTTNEPGYTNTGDTVYALEKLNVRKSASTSGEKIRTKKKDDKTKRISVGANGWDKIEFNGGTGYVMSKYLTTKSPEDRAKEEPKWTDTNDTVYSLADLNVREGWGTSYKTIGSLTVGQSTKRLATGANGWDKIEYNGKTAYVTSKYLTTDKAKADEKLAELGEDEENEVNNTVQDNTVTDTNTVVGNMDIYNTIVEEIGVLPQVGKSTGSYIYYISIILSMIMVAVVGLKIRSKENEE